MIIVGSQALSLRYPQALFRSPMDYDYVGTESEYQQFLTEHPDLTPTLETPRKRVLSGGQLPIEWEISQHGSSAELLLNLVEFSPYSMATPDGWVPSLDVLFTLKTSHRYLKDSPHFWKNLVFYHTMKKMGAIVRPEMQDFLKLREKETYAQTHPRLNQGKEAFFSDDSINYVYDHDTIHESVATFDKPAYMYYMKDGAEVQTDKKKFLAAPRQIQLAGVVEESAVLAIERSLVPHPGVKTPKEAWAYALAKVCTSITSGYFREFAYENAFEVLKLYPGNYWEKFQHDLADGLIKPFTKGM